MNFTYHDEGGQTKTFTGSGYLNMKQYGLDANQAKWRIDSMSFGNDEQKEIKAFRPSKDFGVR